MQIALHTKQVAKEHLGLIKSIITLADRYQITTMASRELIEVCQNEKSLLAKKPKVFSQEGLAHTNLVVSIGGDGTLLEAANLVSVFRNKAM